MLRRARLMTPSRVAAPPAAAAAPLAAPAVVNQRLCRERILSSVSCRLACVFSAEHVGRQQMEGAVQNAITFYIPLPAGIGRFALGTLPLLPSRLLLLSDIVPKRCEDVALWLQKDIPVEFRTLI